MWEKYANFTFALTKGVFILVALLIIYHLFIGTIFIVSGISMEPNLHTGQYLYVNKLAYLLRRPQRGEIVILHFPGDPQNKKFVKRLIGLPNEKIELVGNKVFINGHEIIEGYLSPDLAAPNEYKKQIQLGPDDYFLIGDNRAQSNDSRIWGPAHQNNLIGKATTCLFPISHAGILLTPSY